MVSACKRPHLAAYVLVSVGLALRLAAWLQSGTLNMDEAMLALNVMELGWWELLGPLRLGQVAPWGFLLVSNAAASLVGPTEVALRASAFLPSVISLGVFWWLVRETLDEKMSILVAVGLFALLPTLIVQAGTFKQYSMDVAVTCILLAMWKRFDLRWPTILVGMLAPLFSLPSVFALFGIGVGTFMKHPKRTTLAGAIWLIVFWAYWVVSLGHTAGTSMLDHHWQRGFAPVGPELFSWTAIRLADIFRHPVLLVLPFGALGLSLIGAASLWRRHRRFTLVMVGAVGAALAASMARLYPVWGRALFYMVPLAVIAVSVGLITSIRRLGALGSVGWTVAFVLAGLFLPRSGEPIVVWDSRIIQPRPDYPGALKQMDRHGIGDTLYVNEFDSPGIAYYVRRFYPETSVKIERGSSPVERKPRWFIFGSTNEQSDRAVHRRAFVLWMHRHAPFCDTVTASGVEAYRAC